MIFTSLNLEAAGKQHGYLQVSLFTQPRWLGQCDDPYDHHREWSGTYRTRYGW